MGILLVIPGLTRAIFGPHRALGFLLMPTFLLGYLLFFPAAIVLHLFIAAEEEALIPTA